MMRHIQAVEPMEISPVQGLRFTDYGDDSSDSGLEDILWVLSLWDLIWCVGDVGLKP